MDLEEWEVLPDDGFLEINDDDGKKIYSRKYIFDSNNSVFHNYFTCSTPKPSQFVDSTKVHPTVPKQIIPLQIQLEPKIQKTSDDQDHEVTKEVITTQEVPFEINMLPSTISEKIKAPLAMSMETEQDQVSQVFFKKMNKENESRVLSQDMKVESPKSSNKNFVPQIDSTPFPFDENISEDVDKDNMVIKKLDIIDQEDNKGGLKLLNWSMSGIGAICSFGVAAAATICIIFIGNRQKHKQNQQNQMLRFQIFSDDKRIKQVVHHASKLNEAISAARGVPITRAHITVGGYYDVV